MHCGAGGGGLLQPAVIVWLEGMTGAAAAASLNTGQSGPGCAGESCVAQSGTSTAGDVFDSACLCQQRSCFLQPWLDAVHRGVAADHASSCVLSYVELQLSYTHFTASAAARAAVPAAPPPPSLLMRFFRRTLTHPLCSVDTHVMHAHMQDLNGRRTPCVWCLCA